MVARRSFRNSRGPGAEAGALGELGEELEAPSPHDLFSLPGTCPCELTAWGTWFPLAACLPLTAVPHQGSWTWLPLVCQQEASAARCRPGGHPQITPLPGPAAEGRPVGRQMAAEQEEAGAGGGGHISPTWASPAGGGGGDGIEDPRPRSGAYTPAA